MSDFTKFRTAIGGFNRTDVVNYIESSSQAHQQELKKLYQELDILREEKQTLEQKLKAVQECVGVEPPAEQIPKVTCTEEELEAYRRAEATERMANERAEKLREQMRALCDKASGEYQGCFEQVQQAQEEVEKTFRILQQAMQELEKTIESTKNAFDGVTQ